MPDDTLHSLRIDETRPKTQRSAVLIRRVRRELSAMGCPHPDFQGFLVRYARFLTGFLPVAALELDLGALGRLRLTHGGQSAEDWRLTWNPGAGTAPADWLVAAPILYAEAGLGELRLDAAEVDGRRLRDTAAHCARELAFQIKRHEVSRWSETRLGRPLRLVGMSDAVHGLEVFIEKSSQSDLPVLLQGEFGTETPYLAAAIHCCGPRRDRPFVQIDCAHPAGAPEDWFARADGGTLFLSDIDALDPALQNRLPRHLHSRLGQWLDVSGNTRVRVIAATSADLRQLTQSGAFSRALLAELDFLATKIPPLRERQTDIELLVAAALEGHGYDPAEKIGPDLMDFCHAHPWPENVFELERVVARLAVMTGKKAIEARDARRHFPDVPPSPPQDEPAETVPPADEAEASDSWLRPVMEKDARSLASLHPSLRKAVLYLADNYADPIRLDHLARQARVSPSHLCFLFRSEMQTSCKAMLARIRIERAKILLAENADQPITDIALQVGFADLSHFEKRFRREVGGTPRDFRRITKG